MQDITKNLKVTDRIPLLINEIYDTQPIIEAERAELLTESFMQTEDQPMVMRRALALKNVLENMPIVIRDHELIVGNLTVKSRSSQVFPEFSYHWLEDEFDSLGTRNGDSFIVTDDVRKRLEKILPYWNGKTVNELATQYMMPESLEAQASNVFTVGNYYFNGVGHISVDYAKVLRMGYKGIIAEAEEALKDLKQLDSMFVKKQQFLNSVVISCQGAINFANRFADLADKMAKNESDKTRKAELIQIGKNCRNVPENPAETFYEAVQSFWFIHAMIQIESNGHSISPTRFDQYMYPYYKKDVEENGLDNNFALELIDCTYIKLTEINKVRDQVSTKAFGGYPLFQNLIVGGQTPEGLDATNELSFMCLEACAHTQVSQPSVSIRIWNSTPEELSIKAAEITRLGLGVPAYYNDEVIIPALLSRGVAIEDARDYGIIGCVEPQKPGKTEGWHDSGFFNLVKLFEVMMNNGRNDEGKQIGPKTGEFTEFKSFEELLVAYKAQMAFFVQMMVNANNSVDIAHAERAPLPYLSSMVDDCIGKGQTLQEGGAHYNFTGPQGVGVANVGDSLMVIKKLVFDEKKISLVDLKKAIDSNFGEKAPSSQCTNDEDMLEKVIMQKVYEILAKQNKISDTDIPKAGTDASIGTYNDGEYVRQMLINQAPKYGNDIPEVDALAREGALVYCKEVEKYNNPRGGTFHAGLYPASINVLFGAVAGAGPDGRKAGTPVADGVSPSAGMDTNGPTAVMNSVATLDHSIASNGTLLNQKFHPNVVAGEEGIYKFIDVVKTYFDQKGMHVQFNVITREKLVDAQANPEKYRNLVVRVAGYSAQFVSLDSAVQNDIINRTEQTFEG
jgi:formate C-acetyltransferase